MFIGVASSNRLPSVHVVLIDDVERQIRRTPGLTAMELARVLFGDNGYDQRVSAECRALAYVGRIERRGKGGPGHPFTYFPAVICQIV